MDSFLAELYGTNEPTQEDFEKVAHLDFLEKVAAEEGIDLNELSDADLEELAEVAAEALEEAEVEESEEEYEEDDGIVEDVDDDLEKEAEAKVEEADFLGRVMAHSFNQELDSIELEKEAGARIDKAKSIAAEGARRVYRSSQATREGREGMKAIRRMTQPATLKGRMKARAKALGAKVDRGARRVGERLGAESDAAAKARGAASGRAAGMAQPRPGGKARRAFDYMTMGKRRRGRAGARAGAAEALAGARKSQRRRGYGAMGAAAGLGAGAAAAAGREKKSADEMWEDAIQARAWEHLMAAGLADDQGNYIPAEELDKTAGTDNAEFEVDAAALELLEAEGYPVEWY